MLSVRIAKEMIKLIQSYKQSNYLKSLNMTMGYNLPISIFMKEKYARLSDEMAQVNRRYLN